MAHDLRSRPVAARLVGCFRNPGETNRKIVETAAAFGGKEDLPRLRDRMQFSHARAPPHTGLYRDNSPAPPRVHQRRIKINTQPLGPWL